MGWQLRPSLTALVPVLGLAGIPHAILVAAWLTFLLALVTLRGPAFSIQTTGVST